MPSPLEELIADYRHLRSSTCGAAADRNDALIVRVEEAWKAMGEACHADVDLYLSLRDAIQSSPVGKGSVQMGTFKTYMSLMRERIEVNRAALRKAGAK
jgi:hypothetical protein